MLHAKAEREMFQETEVPYMLSFQNRVPYLPACGSVECILLPLPSLTASCISG